MPWIQYSLTTYSKTQILVCRSSSRGNDGVRGGVIVKGWGHRDNTKYAINTSLLFYFLLFLFNKFLFHGFVLCSCVVFAWSDSVCWLVDVLLILSFDSVLRGSVEPVWRLGRRRYEEQQTATTTTTPQHWSWLTLHRPLMLCFCRNYQTKLLYCCTTINILTDDNGNAMLPKQVWISKIPAIRFLYLSLWAQIFEKNVSNFSKKLNKWFLGRCWAKIGLRKARPDVRSNRRGSESWTDIDRENQRLRHEFWTGHAR